MPNNPTPLDYETPSPQTGISWAHARKFYGHFAAAYGTCWLAMLSAAVLSQSNINTGLFGLLGFPTIGIVYAIVRMRS